MNTGGERTQVGPRQRAMMTRRDLLRSMGLLGAVAVATPALSSCGKSSSAGNVPGQLAGYAKADVARYLGASSARPAAVDAVRAFSVDLYQRIAAAQTGNVICSPYSVAIALAMARNGARGSTADEMGTVLHAAGDLQRFNEGMNVLALSVEGNAGEYKRLDGSKATVSLDVANSLWGQRGEAWERPFLEALARYYGAGMRTVDYERDFESARLVINEWTSHQTQEKIPHLLPPESLDALTRLVLVNAIYLKAPWDTPFDKSFTRARPFTLTDGRRVSPQTMQGGFASVMNRGAGWRSVRLPYAGQVLAMTIVVPTTSVQSLEQSLGTTSLSAMLAESGSQQVLLTLPKWNFRLASPLKNTLSALGMPTAFDAHKADFSGMTQQDPLFIGGVQHAAYISVDEQGTEAAAATGVLFEGSGEPAPSQPFVVDRPFLFVIHDRATATPLFIGRVLDPTAA